eukprot:scaffold524866_cov17-Prasinocladus_malaysianus.AAC.1
MGNIQPRPVRVHRKPGATYSSLWPAIAPVPLAGGGVPAGHYGLGAYQSCPASYDRLSAAREA